MIPVQTAGNTVQHRLQIARRIQEDHKISKSMEIPPSSTISKTKNGISVPLLFFAAKDYHNTTNKVVSNTARGNHDDRCYGGGTLLPPRIPSSARVEHSSRVRPTNTDDDGCFKRPSNNTFMVVVGEGGRCRSGSFSSPHISAPLLPPSPKTRSTQQVLVPCRPSRVAPRNQPPSFNDGGCSGEEEDAQDLCKSTQATLDRRKKEKKMRNAAHSKALDEFETRRQDAEKSTTRIGASRLTLDTTERKTRMQRRTSSQGSSIMIPSRKDGGRGSLNTNFIGVLEKDATSVKYYSRQELDASRNVMKYLFHKELAMGNPILAKLREQEPDVVLEILAETVRDKKTISREEFFIFVSQVLQDPHCCTKKDCDLFFRMFDDFAIAVVDVVEFLHRFRSTLLRIEEEEDDEIAFRALAALRATAESSAGRNIFLTLFEFQLVIGAAHRFFKGDEAAQGVLAGFQERFNFSVHHGKIPLLDFHNGINKDPILQEIFTKVPNPLLDHSLKSSAVHASENSSFVLDGTNKSLVGLCSDSTTDNNMNPLSDQRPSSTSNKKRTDLSHFIVDGDRREDEEIGRRAMEHGLPRWHYYLGTIYRTTTEEPKPVPMFRQEVTLVPV